MEDERCAGIDGQLQGLAALVIRVEDEAALVVALNSTIRTDGRPSAVAVASAVASGCGSPAASASAYQAANCDSGSSVELRAGPCG